MKEKPICMEQGVKLAKEVSWRFKSSNLLGITVCVLYFPYLYFIFLYEKTCSIHTKGSAQPTGNPWLKSIHSATAQSYSGAEEMTNPRSSNRCSIPVVMWLQSKCSGAQLQLQSHSVSRHMFAICNLPCHLSTSKVNVEAAREGCMSPQ